MFTLSKRISKKIKAEDAEIARLGEERIIIAPSSIKIWKPEYDLK
jgi:SepF-like predicted cell division protein (DUF552 family)